MKSILSLLMISTATIGFSQNTINNDAIQQQSIQYSNVSLNNSNVSNYNVNPVVQNNMANVFRRANNVRNQTSQSRVSRGNPVRNQTIQSRGSRGNGGNTINVIDQLDNVGTINDNANQNKEVEQKQIELEAPKLNVNLNLNLNVPAINLKKTTVEEVRVKEEKVAPRRLEDFRIKTENGSSSGAVSHHKKKEKKSFRKKVLKPINCWVKRTFKRNTRFHFSCECFKF